MLAVNMPTAAGAHTLRAAGNDSEFGGIVKDDMQKWEKACVGVCTYVCY